MDKLVKISYGQTMGDCTCNYYIDIKKKFTVKDFIKAVISNKNEWGYIGIDDGESIFGNPKIEYRYGEIISDSFDDDILNKTVKRLSGSGGWSRSDYLLAI